MSRCEGDVPRNSRSKAMCSSDCHQHVKSTLTCNCHSQTCFVATFVPKLAQRSLLTIPKPAPNSPTSPPTRPDDFRIVPLERPDVFFFSPDRSPDSSARVPDRYCDYSGSGFSAHDNTTTRQAQATRQHWTTKQHHTSRQE